MCKVEVRADCGDVLSRVNRREETMGLRRKFWR
jgi:hypothetical protein